MVRVSRDSNIRNRDGIEMLTRTNHISLYEHLQSSPKEWNVLTNAEMDRVKKLYERDE